jgi:CheY-like chemotaxis protein
MAPIDIPPLNIMIVEDEAVIAMLLGEVLAGLGHSICASVATEDEAVATALAHGPDLIIVDAGLRDGSGVAAMARIVQNRAIPHVFITGNVARVIASAPGAVVIEKPFHEADLMAAIGRALA